LAFPIRLARNVARLQEIRIPKYPECWETCGSCASGDLFIQSVLVSPGQKVGRDDTVVVLETGKVALDIPAGCEGVVVRVCVEENDPIAEGALLAVVDVEGV
jgi:biotin carboxyl carrier protein